MLFMLFLFIFFVAKGRYEFIGYNELPSPCQRICSNSVPIFLNQYFLESQTIVVVVPELAPLPLCGRCRWHAQRVYIHSFCRNNNGCLLVIYDVLSK